MLLSLSFVFCLWLAVSASGVTAQLHWPPGTIAAGSDETTGGPSPVDNRAIDGDRSTSWDARTIGKFPIRITIIPPQQLNLSGVELFSLGEGWPTHYTVDDLENKSWMRLCEVRDLTSYISHASFDGPSLSEMLNITIFNTSTSTNTPPTARISEIIPHYANESTPSSTSSNGPSTQSPSCPSAHESPSARNNHSGIAIGAICGGCIVLIIISAIIFRVRRRTKRGQPQVWDRLLRRRESSPPSNIVPEAPSSTQRTELESLHQIRRDNGSNARAQGTELAGSALPRAELPMVQDVVPTVLAGPPPSNQVNAHSSSLDAAAPRNALMKDLPELPNEEAGRASFPRRWTFR
ncbi:MAG: hypothetical protein Q9160_001979 [Pyrenula sp. 1 TL-2023]